MSAGPPALACYRLTTALLEPLAPLWLEARGRRGKEDPARRGERLGRASLARPRGRLVWLHGASVGEATSLLPLVERLRAAPSAPAVLVTSGTTTSAAVLGRRLPAGVLQQYAPIDTPAAAARFVAHWRPDAAVFVESEIWPNLLLATRRGGARTALLSGRLSPSSVARWRGVPASARRLFGGFDLVMAQDDPAGAALTALGARDDGRLNLKLAGSPLPVDDAALQRARTAAAGRPVLLAASTHAGEDAVVLDAFAPLAPRARLVIAPRHPFRGPAIADLARARGLDVGLRSRGDVFGATSVHVADTLGELGLWLRLCEAAFVGGSLLPGPGGHNPLEAARLERRILTGPHTAAWRDVYARLGDAAVTVADAQALATAWSGVLADPAAGVEARRALARDLAEAARSSLEVTAARMLALLGAERP